MLAKVREYCQRVLSRCRNIVDTAVHARLDPLVAKLTPSLRWLIRLWLFKIDKETLQTNDKLLIFRFFSQFYPYAQLLTPLLVGLLSISSLPKALSSPSSSEMAADFFSPPGAATTPALVRVLQLIAVSSFSQVLCRFFAGRFADQIGPRSSVRLGLWIMSAANLLLTLAFIWKCFAPDFVAKHIIWLLIFVEILIGVAFSFALGSDTVLFLTLSSGTEPVPDKAASNVSWEFVGTSVRSFGSALAICLGALAYYVIPHFFAARISWDACQRFVAIFLFGLASFGGLIADNIVATLPEPKKETAQKTYPFRAILDHFWGDPQLRVPLWNLAFAEGVSIFTSYSILMPLNEYTNKLSKDHTHFLMKSLTVAVAFVLALSSLVGRSAHGRFKIKPKGPDFLIKLLSWSIPITTILVVWFCRYVPSLVSRPVALFSSLIATLFIFNFLRGWMGPLVRSIATSRAPSEMKNFLTGSFDLFARFNHLVLTLLFTLCVLLNANLALILTLYAIIWMLLIPPCWDPVSSLLKSVQPLFDLTKWFRSG